MWWIGVRVFAVAVGTLLVVGGASAPGLAAVNCCNCIGCPTGVSACLTEPSEVDVCAQLGCTGVSMLCLPGNCTAGREDICPATEAGQCADGVDNDFNGQIDCADAACAINSACFPAAAPALGPFAISALLLALASIEYWRRRRALGRPQR